jgi:prefoldin subunit 5
MADYQLIINKANEIIQLATNANGVSELIDSIDVNDGAVINPVGTELNFVDTSGETKDLITAKIATLETNLTDINTAIDELADEIIEAL